jgi:hypothetical protein
MSSRIAPFDPHPKTDSGYRAARRQLRTAFLRWAKADAAGASPDCFDDLIHLKWRDLDGHLTRWRTGDLDAVLLELFPAKVIVEDADLDDIVPDTATFVRFLADTGLLDPASDQPAELYARIERIGRRFQRRMADRRRYKPGKRFWLAAAEAGVALDDDQAIEAFIEEFNALPRAQREAVLGRRTKLLTSHGLVTSLPSPTQHPDQQ